MASDIRLYALAARAFAVTRWRAATLSSTKAIRRHQARELNRLRRYASAQFPFYQGLSDIDFAHWPIIDKAAMLAQFHRMNRAGLRADEVREILSAGGERFGDFVLGHSTGTSGNRGYYVISDAERFVWLGTILAKTLPDALWRRHRVALALPGLSSLYRSASSGSRIQLGFFDLAKGVDSWATAFAEFAADTVVAPPKVLRLLAERGLLRAHHIFSGAEVLDPLDRAVIEDATGRVVREIYMATEGLFGVSCPHGTLHLAEDVVAFEWETAADGSPLCAPIVTDFTRRSQAMIRYRMNDLMALSDQPCPCGSRYQAVQSIVGRADDIVMLHPSSGSAVAITPDVLRNAVVDADARVTDFRIVQTGPCGLTITLPRDCPAEVEDAVRQLVTQRLNPFGVAPDIIVTRGMTVPFDQKLRRVKGLGARDT